MVIKNKREKEMLHANVVAIVINLLIALVKGITGILVGSISFITDAFSNVSECGQSLFSIVNTLLANKEPDRSHPFGYGRLEYINGLLIAMFVMYTGLKTLESSIPRIFNPVHPDYTWASLFVISITILFKVADGIHAYTLGKKVDAGSLQAAGSNAFWNAAMTALTVISAWISMTFHVTIDGYVGVVISLIIIHTGWRIIKGSLDKIVGRPADYEYSKQIMDMVENTPGILSAHDLIIHNYGPTQNFATIDVEFDSNMTMGQAYPIVRQLQNDIEQKFKITTVFGFYAVNAEQKETQKLIEIMKEIDKADPQILGFHAPYIDNAKKAVYVDLEIDYGSDRNKAKELTEQMLEKAFKGYTAWVTIDTKF